MFLFALNLLLAFAPSGGAEYRVFNLKITDSAGGQERSEISTMTPAQYRAYRGLKSTEQVTYTETWMCKGNTSQQKPACPNPK